MNYIADKVKKSKEGYQGIIIRNLCTIHSLLNGEVNHTNTVIVMPSYLFESILNLGCELNKIAEDNEEDNTIISNSKNVRSDTLLIKFKAALGKWFIKKINHKIKLLKQNSVIKRSIKFYAFNYKKFTLKVSYTQNKEWLKNEMKYLLLLGDEDNQIKNKKGISSLYKKNLAEFKEIKDMLDSTYEETIKEFYKSETFEKFKMNKRVKELNYNFNKIMGISLLEKNGFVEFIDKRKGNTKKEK